MKVFELAKKLKKKSKEILDAAEYLNIQVKSHLSKLSDDEVKKIIKYFRKRRLIFFFKKYFALFLLFFLVTIIFLIMYPQSVVSGEIEASVNEVGELTLDWKINESIEDGAILIESESELLIIEIDESIGSILECCFEEDLNILLLLTDENDEIIEVESVNLPLSNKSISTTSTTSTTSTSTTTSITIPECNDEDFNPYTLYDSEGNANTVLTCQNEKDALDAGFIYTINPNPTEPTTTTLAPTTTTSSTTTTLAPTTTTTTSTTTTSTTTTLPLLINEFPTGEKLNEFSSCKKIKKGKNQGKYRFSYTAILKSDSKNYQYKFIYKINNGEPVQWKNKFKGIKNKQLRIRVNRLINKNKKQINSFEYKFIYRLKGQQIQTETSIYSVKDGIPCTVTGIPPTTTTTIDEKQIGLKFTDDVSVRSIATTSTTLAPTTTTTTTPTTTTTLPECNDDDFMPYTLYDSDGNGNTVMSCSNEQDALDSGFTNTVNPNPPPPITTTTTTIPSSIDITTGETYVTACNYLSNNAGERSYSIYFTNNESQSIYLLYNNTFGLAAVEVSPNETRTFSTYGAVHGVNSRQYKAAFTEAGLNDTEFITRNFNLDCQADIDITHSLASCAGSKGSRTRLSALSFTNNESDTAYVITRYSTNGGSTWSGNVSTTVSAGATVSGPDYVVPNGGSIIWQSHKGFSASTNIGWQDSDYYTENTSNTIDCPDGYYVNVDGSNTYSLDVECKKWNNTTKVRFQANPWWGDYNLAKDYMFALIALTGDYDNSDSSVDVEDYFDYSQFTCGVVPGAYFAYQKGFVQFIGQAITAPSWNSTTDVEDGSSNQKDFYIFSELVP